MRGIIAIVQARLESTRLPNKVMLEVIGKPIIDILLYRLSKSKNLDSIVVAISKSEKSLNLAKYISNLGYRIYLGSEEDVLDRYYNAAKEYQAKTIVRITADCPFSDPNLIDELIDRFNYLKCDYLSNTLKPTFPDGLDVEVFTFDALEYACNNATKVFDREHVTPFIKANDKFNCHNFSYTIDLSNLRWTLDERQDYIVIKEVIESFNHLDFSWKDVLKLFEDNSEIFKINMHIPRNEGSTITTGQKLWKRAKSIIPGGNMLLSKRPEMFLPDLWPTYYSKAKECFVWDLDGKKYVDVSLMGVGTNLLGYCHPEVDKSVSAAISSGTMSTLNCPEEVYLAEKLIEINPWSDMVRLARTGGEANSIAIRIARAATGRDKIAICGYHGWHDWYLSANLKGTDNLSGHLLPGLDPNGVPRNLKGTTLPFDFNNVTQIESIVENNEIAAIKMEVERNIKPNKNFLNIIRNLCSQKGIVLIFDECTSGFRETFGGLHKKYGVEPDIAVFGKALGNGYPITAVVGRRDIMEFAQSSFISSTFWTDRIGPVAAIKTLDIMESISSWEYISKIGEYVASKWKDLANKYQLPIKVSGISAMPTFKILSNNYNKYKAYITQDMLHHGYLASNSFYASTSHSYQILDEYLFYLDNIFKVIKDCEEGMSIEKLLDSREPHKGFYRLN